MFFRTSFFDAFGTTFAPKMGGLKRSFFHVFCICGPLRPHMAPLGFFWARFGRFLGTFLPLFGLLLAPFGPLLAHFCLLPDTSERSSWSCLHHLLTMLGLVIDLRIVCVFLIVDNLVGGISFLSHYCVPPRQNTHFPKLI